MSFVEETVFSPLCGLDTLVKDYLTVYGRIYFWALYSVPLVYGSIFMSVPHYLDYCSFIIYFGIRNHAIDFWEEHCGGEVPFSLCHIEELYDSNMIYHW